MGKFIFEQANMPSMNTSRLSTLLFFFALPSCSETQRSFVNHDFVEAKAQTRALAVQLWFYKLDNKKFPESLESLEIFNANDINLKDIDIGMWKYEFINNGENYSLAYITQINGHYIYVNRQGKVVSNESAPTQSEIIFQGFYDEDGAF